MKKGKIEAGIFIITITTALFLGVYSAEAASWRELIQAEIDKCDRALESDIAACKANNNGKLDLRCLQTANQDHDTCADRHNIRKAAKAARLEAKKIKALEKAEAAFNTAREKCYATTEKKAAKCAKIKNAEKSMKCSDKAGKWQTKCLDKAQAKYDKKKKKLE